MIIYPLMTDGCKRGCCSIEPEGHGMDARGTVARLGKRDADDGWMQEGRLLNWARGTWMMDGWMPNWPWRDASVGEKDAQSGGGTFLWERRTLD